jgi:hypothetical protein
VRQAGVAWGAGSQVAWRWDASRAPRPASRLGSASHVFGNS